MSMFSESLRAFLKPVVPFLDDPDVSEILINGPKEIWVERRGKLHKTEVTFTEEGLLAAARNMAQYVGRPLTEERPRLDARLPDGSRIHVVLAPVARRGTTISIRKFFAETLTVEKLVQLGSLTKRVARLLEAAVGLRLNIVVSGGTGSGKTSLLNVLTQFIAEEERILTIEDSAELQLTQPHIVGFESRPADRLGKGQVDIADLLQSALRMRPDRIVVGEVRGGECFYLLQAMNTGHGGTLTSAHANTPVDTLRRLESLCLLSGVELPLIAVRAQVASAVHVVVCCERFGDGSRKVTHISEVLPLDERGEYRVQDLVSYQQTSRDADGRVRGQFVTHGALPSFFARLSAGGFGDVDQAYFAKGVEVPPELERHDETTDEHEPVSPARDDHHQAIDLSPTPPDDDHEPEPSTRETLPDRPALRPAPKPAAAARPKPAGEPRTPPTPRKPEPEPRIAEASIELDPELQAEVEARLQSESTLITRNPLERRADDDTQPGTRRRS
jgi:pilus assembly protein CpaF